jgi:pimeloyl-ACP methyl ester carboxylesterase
MANFLLVHGSNHGAWCWRDLIPALHALGHTARAIDLPSHGEDTTPIAKVTLDLYAHAILDALDRPTVLVGHSAGGFAITQAAEIDPSNIAGLAFVCAYVPVAGKSLVDMLRDAPSQPLRGGLEVGHDGAAFRFKEDTARRLVYHDCPPEAVEFALAHVGWQAMAPQTTPVAFTGKGANLPRDYVLCTGDRTIEPDHQRQMSAGFAEGHLHELNTGHCPFLANPEGLAALLDRIVAKD